MGTLEFTLFLERTGSSDRWRAASDDAESADVEASVSTVLARPSCPLGDARAPPELGVGGAP